MKREVSGREVAGKILEIEEEMKRLGLWQDGPLREEQYEFRQAFAADTMTFAQWLQFVLIPKVKGIIEAGGEFPARSEVGAKAFREFVMWPAYGDLDAERLLRLLDEFDALFGR